MELVTSLMSLLPAQPARASAVILVLAVVVVVFLHRLVSGLNTGRTFWQRRLRARLGVAQGRVIGELRWMLLSFHLLLWPGVTWAVLHVWGLHETGSDLVARLFSTGFAFGSVHLVPGKLLLGVVYFLVLFTFTRWLKNKIEYDWLPRAGVEASTRESVATLFGYVTFALAVVVGLSSAGFDFTKLAIVAGALSVGIGFGLQNIVNNFVSGLIILFERPVRTGDYVFVGQTQGFVRRIRIRSTEIQTWDRESVIVPNSDLLSSHLRNLNLRDNYGRVIVPVGVAYGSDTARVKAVLLEVANAHPLVIRDNQVEGINGPGVLFVNFGASSLDFELRAYVREVDKRMAVASDLRFAIDTAFRAAGIQIPFPQQDVWLRSEPQASPGARADSDKA
ncbi:mechanosensitive ion channel domain-containing protein [Fontimonas sp. SYSU GA230001]|uniref:mechanosensitive ion channel family protein n=1 Tax=Fontimonas sp. SYSU GA230001 TaxID=3142450 RepID=UPI0032B56720